MIDDRHVSVRSIIDDYLHALGQSLASAWPIDRGATFERLLKAIDDADEDAGTRRGGAVDLPKV